MRNDTRLAYAMYVARIAELNGIADATVKFSATPSVQQTLETKMQESSAFLQAINVIGVDELKGEKVGLGITGTIAGRTDTSGAGERVPRNVVDTSANTYECKQTDFDTAIPYGLLDAWAKFPDFQVRIRDAILRRQALDRIMIGFNGTSAAATSNRATNPLLQDVNIGWIQQYKTNAPENVLSEVVAASGQVKVGATGDYKNLDALVLDTVSNLIDPWFARDPGLVAIAPRELVHDKYFPLVNNNDTPTEKLATDLILSQRRMGGLPLVEVPFIPADTLVITSLKNLSLYWQIGGRRRFIKEAPEKNQVQNFESSNDAYVVEDYGFGCVIENITLV